MAKDLKKIIYFHQNLIDEKRKALGGFLNQISNYEKQRDYFEANIKAEKHNASNTNNIVAMFYGGYVASTYQKIREVEIKIDELEGSIENIQQEIRLLFKEKKVFEITQNKHDERARKDKIKLEQVFLDELGQETYRRLKNL